jgi:hypothetical protein
MRAYRERKRSGLTGHQIYTKDDRLIEVLKRKTPWLQMEEPTHEDINEAIENLVALWVEVEYENH